MTMRRDLSDCSEGYAAQAAGVAERMGGGAPRRALAAGWAAVRRVLTAGGGG